MINPPISSQMEDRTVKTFADIKRSHVVISTRPLASKFGILLHHRATTFMSNATATPLPRAKGNCSRRKAIAEVLSIDTDLHWAEKITDRSPENSSFINIASRADHPSLATASSKGLRNTHSITSCSKLRFEATRPRRKSSCAKTAGSSA